MARNRILVLDFDGVICDGANECLLTAWNTWHRLDVDAFSEETLRSIPSAFVARFTEMRPFVRHSGHFLVAFVAEGKRCDSQKDFERIYASIADDVINQFLSNLEAYRVAVIDQKKAVWLRMHRFYPGIENVLRRWSSRVYVVSGKDLTSIQCLLASQGIVVDDTHIFASQRQKPPVLRLIGEREKIEPQDVVFCDDNLSNVFEARENGICALWAGWGYQTPDDREQAVAHGVPCMSLQEFLGLYDRDMEEGDENRSRITVS